MHFADRTEPLPQVGQAHPGLAQAQQQNLHSSPLAQLCEAAERDVAATGHSDGSSLEAHFAQQQTPVCSNVSDNLREGRYVQLLDSAPAPLALHHPELLETCPLAAQDDIHVMRTSHAFDAFVRGRLEPQ